VIAQCTIGCDLLVFELEGKFLNHKLINVLGIIYSQYWLQPNSEFIFVDNLVSNNIIAFLKKLVLMGSRFLSIFMGHIGFTKLFFHVDHEKPSFENYGRT
jgi:hypothetical protein